MQNFRLLQNRLLCGHWCCLMVSRVERVKFPLPAANISDLSQTHEKRGRTNFPPMVKLLYTPFKRVHAHKCRAMLYPLHPNQCLDFVDWYCFIFLVGFLTAINSLGLSVTSCAPWLTRPTVHWCTSALVHWCIGALVH